MGTEKRSAPLSRSFEFERDVQTGKHGRWYIKDACTSNGTILISRLSHVPFSRFPVAGAPAVSKDYAARCIRFSAYVRDATMYYTQRDAASAATTATAGTTGAAMSPRRMCAAWCCYTVHTATSLIATTRTSGTEWAARHASSLNRDRGHRMIKSVPWEAKGSKSEIIGTCLYSQKDEFFINFGTN